MFRNMPEGWGSVCVWGGGGGGGGDYIYILFLSHFNNVPFSFISVIHHTFHANTHYISASYHFLRKQSDTEKQMFT